MASIRQLLPWLLWKREGCLCVARFQVKMTREYSQINTVCENVYTLPKLNALWISRLKGTKKSAPVRISQHHGYLGMRCVYWSAGLTGSMDPGDLVCTAMQISFVALALVLESGVFWGADHILRKMN